jgi:hypothetical protein
VIKPSSWPIAIKQGSVTVRIYRTPEGARDRFTVEWREGGARKRVTRVDLAEARALAKETAARLDNGKGAGLILSGAKRDAYLHVSKKLNKAGLDLVLAVDEFLEAKKVGVPLLPAAKFYHEAHSSKLPDKTVFEVVVGFLQAKKADGRSLRYLQDCKARLERFSRDFRVNLKDVRTPDLDAWLRALKLSPRSRNNFRTVISSLFSFAKASGYLAKDRPTEAEATTLAKQDDGDIVIFTPVEFSRLLNAADAHVLPFLIFGGMAGLRSAEILRLKWENVNWPEGIIEIQGKVAKTGARRLAPLLPAAIAWLKPYTGARGPVIGSIKLYERKARAYFGNRTLFVTAFAAIEWRP